MKTVYEFIRSDKGLETVEWAVLAAGIIAVIVAVVAQLGSAVKANFERLRADIAP